jgi:hypothetical protein
MYKHVYEVYISISYNKSCNCMYKHVLAIELGGANLINLADVTTSINTCKWEPKEKSLSYSIAVLDLDPVYGTASRISEIKANYFMGTKEKKNG